MEDKEQPQEQEVEQEQVEEQGEEVAEEQEEERPEANWKAELARKNAEIARLKAERMEAPVERKRDPQDITTWTDQELKMLRNSSDPTVLAYKEQADEILLERKVKQIQARDYENKRKEETHSKLEAEYPEALDSSTDFGRKVDQVMKEYDLSRTPAGRLVAAKIVAAEGKASKAKGQGREADRVNRVKGQMVDGDRPKPTDSGKDLETKRKNLGDALLSGKERQQVDAISDILKDRGMTRDNFFGKKK